MRRPAVLLAALVACAVPDAAVSTAVPAPALVVSARDVAASHGASAEEVSAEEGVRVRVDAPCAGVVLYELSAGDHAVRGRAPTGIAVGLRWPGPDERAVLRYGCDDDDDGVVSGDGLVVQPIAWRIDRARTIVLALPRRDPLDALVAPATATPP